MHSWLAASAIQPVASARISEWMGSGARSSPQPLSTRSTTKPSRQLSLFDAEGGGEQRLAAR